MQPFMLTALTGGQIKFTLHAFIGGTSNQDFTDAQVLDTVAEGVIDGQLTVVEVDGTLAAVNGKLAFTAQSSPVIGDLGFYSQAMVKSLGRSFFYALNLSATDKTLSGLGWFSDSALTITDREFSLQFDAMGNIDFRGASTPPSQDDIGVYSAATDYSIAIVLGGYNSGVPWKLGDDISLFLDGAVVFMRGGVYSTWTRLFQTAFSNTSPLYAGFSNQVAAGTLDNLLVPQYDFSRVLVQPRFLATYQGTNGDSIRDVYEPDVVAGVSNPGVTALQSAADTWDIQSNQARNTPGVGGELVVFGSMSNPAPWDEGVGWSIGSGVATWTHGSGDGTLAQTGILTVGAITRLIYTVFANTSDGVLKSSAMASPERTFPSTVATHTVYFRAATTDLNLSMTGGTGGAISLDNISARIVPLNRAFTSDDMGIDELIIDVSLTIPTANDGFAGIVFLLDDKDTPENYGEAIYDRSTGKVELNKYLSSSRTSLINVTATYSAGAQLRVIAYNVAGGDVELRLFYNQAAIGTVQTLDATTDAAIIGNARHGQTSVDTDTRISILSVMKRTDPLWDAEITRGTGGVY